MAGKAQKRLLVTIVVSAILLVAVGVGIHYSSQPAFCASCHEIAPVVSAWEGSAHSGVDCLECHADPGIVGLAKVKVGGLREVYLQMTNPPKSEEIKGDVPNSRCLKCHEETLAKMEGSKAQIHSNKDLECATCHRQSIHGTRDEHKINQITLKDSDKCISCHTDEAAIDKLAVKQVVASGSTG